MLFWLIIRLDSMLRSIFNSSPLKSFIVELSWRPLSGHTVARTQSTRIAAANGSIYWHGQWVPSWRCHVLNGAQKFYGNQPVGAPNWRPINRHLIEPLTLFPTKAHRTELGNDSSKIAPFGTRTGHKGALGFSFSFAMRSSCFYRFRYYNFGINFTIFLWRFRFNLPVSPASVQARALPLSWTSNSEVDSKGVTSL